MDNITISQLTGWVLGGLVAVTGIIQISPIKLNPWSWIAKHVGRAVNAEVIEKVDKLEADLDEMKRTNAEGRAKQNRTVILRFGDELRLGVKHSKDSFDNILVTISDYDLYCQAHPEFKNKIAEVNEKYITQIYEECLRNNTFL